MTPIPTLEKTARALAIYDRTQQAKPKVASAEYGVWMKVEQEAMRLLRFQYASETGVAEARPLEEMRSWVLAWKATQ